MGNDQSNKSLSSSLASKSKQKEKLQSAALANYSASVDVASSSGESNAGNSKESETINRGRSVSIPSASTRLKPEAIKPRSKHDTLVVVNRGQSPASDGSDGTLKRLHSIPLFTPLLAQQSGLPGPPLGLDAAASLQLCHRLQEHLKLCADAVSFDQNALCVRIKEVELAVTMLHGVLHERQKRLARQQEQVARVTELNTALSKVRVGLGHTASLLQSLNDVLPEQLRLEDLQLGLLPPRRHQHPKQTIAPSRHSDPQTHVSTQSDRSNPSEPRKVSGSTDKSMGKSVQSTTQLDKIPANKPVVAETNCTKQTESYVLEPSAEMDSSSVTQYDSTEVMSRTTH